MGGESFSVSGFLRLVHAAATHHIRGAGITPLDARQEGGKNEDTFGQRNGVS
jgi:hypothetical protein